MSSQSSSSQASGARRAFSLVEILVVVLLLMVLAAVMMPRYLGGGKRSDGKPIESPMQRAHTTECINYLSQIRQAYTMATSTGDETRPQSLMDLKTYGVSESMMSCPTGKEPYQFDPATGRVWCPHPGHEKF